MADAFELADYLPLSFESKNASIFFGTPSGQITKPENISSLFSLFHMLTMSFVYFTPPPYTICPPHELPAPAVHP